MATFNSDMYPTVPDTVPWQHSTATCTVLYLTPYKGNELLYFHGNTFNIFILLRVTCIANNTQKTHRCFCKATMVTRTPHDLALSVYRLSCYKPLTIPVPCNSSFSRTHFVKTTNKTQWPNKRTDRPPSLLLGQWYQSTASRTHATDTTTTGNHYRNTHPNTINVTIKQRRSQLQKGRWTK